MMNLESGIDEIPVRPRNDTNFPILSPLDTISTIKNLNNSEENLNKQEVNYQNFKGGGTPQLWYFILELLLEPVKYSKIIAWTGRDWEFKFIEPDDIAILWGIRKTKHKMNYDKMSRGIRYYYDKKIIKKISHYRYVYEFVCPELLNRILKVTSAAEIHTQYGVAPKIDEDRRARHSKDVPVGVFFNGPSKVFGVTNDRVGNPPGHLANLNNNRYIIDEKVHNNQKK